jgi:replicative DNA helicase Mcm
LSSTNFLIAHDILFFWGKKMDPVQQIKQFEEFIRLHHHAELLAKVSKGEYYLIINFAQLSQFDPDLANELLEDPEEVIKAAEVAVKEFDLPVKTKDFKVRFTHLPESQQVMVRDIRSKHISKFVSVIGLIRQKSDVRPQVTTARFECPSCGNVISVLQLDTKFREPSRCGCGRKGKFKLLSKELVDAQRIVLEEAAEMLDGGEQPKRMDVFTKQDLVSPLSERRTNPGTKVIINGIVKEVPITLRDGGQSIRFDLLIEANIMEPMEEDYGDILISPEEQEEIKKIAKSTDFLKKLTESLAPSIYGHDMIKQAIMLQLVGGVRKVRDDGVSNRGDMHLLLIGDPGAGKCVAGNTKIVLSSGEIITLKEFYKKQGRTQCAAISLNEQGIHHQGNILKVWKRKSPKNLLKITTQTGNELIVTKNHPLFTTNQGLIFAKEAQNYQKGEYLATPSKYTVNGSLQPTPLPQIVSPAKNKVQYTLKPILDQEFARLLGYLIGDGYVRQRKTTGIISFTNNDFVLLHDFEELVKKVFGLKVSKRKKQNSNSYEYYCSSIELVRVLQAINPTIIYTSGEISTGSLLTQSPNEIIKEYLKSLFDCEGHVVLKKREIEFSSKSKDLIQEIQLLLLRFGIQSQCSSGLKYAANTINKTKRRYYRLRISGKDIILFHKYINFNSPDKKKRLEVLVDNKTKFNTNLTVVPYVNKLLKVLRKKYGLTQLSFPLPRTTYQHYERGDRSPSYENLKCILEVYQKLKQKDLLIDLLQQISNAEIFWDKIKSIQTITSQEEYVYDLEIERVHNFIANGVVVHNSQLLKRAQAVAPKSRYVSGKGTSAAGLTASVVKDDFLKGWALEAGALVLANKGFVMIDEMDKMSKEDRSAMHEALEQQQVSISKANIQATLRCETTVLAAANPKFGRFDPYELIAKQIDLPPTLINRFDLIFPVKDLPDPHYDEKLASFLLNIHQQTKIEKAPIETDLLRKYIAYARKNCKPKISNEALEEIKEYYVSMRNSGSDEGGVQSIPITARQLEGLVRMTEGNAKLRLADTATREDAKGAISLLDYCLKQVGMDKETGKIDIDRIGGGMPASQRSKIVIVKEILAELEGKIGKTIPIEDVVREAEQKGVSADQVDEVIEKLKRGGDLFEPKRGLIQKL